MTDLVIFISNGLDFKVAVAKNVSQDLIDLALEYHNQNVDDDDFLDRIETEMSISNHPVLINLNNTVITTIGIF